MIAASQAPPWLETDWLLAYFGNQRDEAVARYIEFLRAGISAAYPDSRLPGPLLWRATPTLALDGSEFHLCGDITNGLAVANGQKIYVLRTLGNDLAHWRELPYALDPDAKNISGIAGDNLLGYAVFTTEGKVYQLSLTDPTHAWKTLPELPINSVTAIAGDIKTGIVLVGAHDDATSNSQLVRSSADLGGWIKLPAAPINIECICGSVSDGFAACGESQLLVFDGVKNWTRAAPLNFSLKAMSGNAKEGLVGLIAGDDSLVIQCSDLNRDSWNVVASLPSAGDPPMGPDLKGNFRQT